MDMHTRVSDLLAASVLDACDANEADAVEAHLRDCPSCAAEARRLRAAAAWFGVERVVAPARKLRHAVLAKAREVRRPSPFRTLTEAYAAQVARLDQLLVTLDQTDWRRADPRHGDLTGVVAHLAANDAMLASDLGLRVVPIPDRPGRVVREAWREQANVLVGGLAREVELDRTVRLAGQGGAQPGPLRQALVQRAFETWTHLDDVGVAVGQPQPIPSPEQVRRIAELAVSVLPAALRAGGVSRPGSARLTLHGAGGGEWTVPLGQQGNGVVVTIVVEAVEFARLVANRRSARTLPYTVTGDEHVAAELLRIAATLGCD
jgi:hypothetical protein